MDLLQPLRLPDVDLDGGARISRHRQILARKKILQAVFGEIQQLLLDLETRHLAEGSGLRIELGSGAATVRDLDEEVLASDVVCAPGLAATMDATRLPLGAGSVGTLFGQNCFHHFSDPDRFLSELGRVAVPGGGAVLLEPYHGPLARWVYPRLFASERFDLEDPSWENPGGPMSEANQALSYLVFERDRAEFEHRHPELEVVCSVPLRNFVRYLLSGGLNFVQLVPDFMNQPLRWVEGLLAPFGRAVALHHALVLRRL